jgi:hypothetical protein
MERKLCLQMDVIYNRIPMSLFGGNHVPQPHIVKYNHAPTLHVDLRCIHPNFILLDYTFYAYYCGPP